MKPRKLSKRELAERRSIFSELHQVTNGKHSAKTFNEFWYGYCPRPAARGEEIIYLPTTDAYVYARK